MILNNILIVFVMLIMFKMTTSYYCSYKYKYHYVSNYQISYLSISNT